MSPRYLLVPLALAALASASCFFLLVPQGGLGESCSASKDCYIGLVCVLLDEDNLDSRHVCMPPVSFDRTGCDADDDCLKAGMPTDSYCTQEGHCACDSLMDGAQLSCETGTVPGRFACACVSNDQGSAGDTCGHPEECQSLTCDGSHCVDECANADDCGGIFTGCDGGQCVE